MLLFFVSSLVKKNPLNVQYNAFVTLHFQSDGKIVEHFFISYVEEEFEGYKLITHTVEGNQAMKNRWLEVRRVPKENADKVICDILIFHGQHEQDIPDYYVRML